MTEANVLPTYHSSKVRSYTLKNHVNYVTETFLATYKPVQTADGTSNISAEELQRAKLRRGLISQPIITPAPEIPPVTTTPEIITPEPQITPPSIDISTRPLRDSLDRQSPPTNHGWREFAMGAVTGTMARLATKQVAAFAGVAGWPYTLLVGGVAGGMAGFTRDLITQYDAAKELPTTRQMLWTDYVLEQQSQNKQVDAVQIMATADPQGIVEVQEPEKSQREQIMHKLRQVDGGRLAKAVLIGAALGILGAVAGGLAVEALNELIERAPSVGIRVPDIKIPGITPPTTPIPPDLSPPYVELPPDVSPDVIQPPQGIPPVGGAEIPPAQPEIPTPALVEIQNLPPVVDLPQGSNVWNESSKALQQILHRQPTNAEILRVAQEISRQSGVTVPEWGIYGQVFHTKMPVGYDLIYNTNVRNVISEIARGR